MEWLVFHLECVAEISLDKSIMFVFFLLITFVVFALIAFYLIRWNFRPPELEQMEASFQENREQIFIVRDFLIVSGYQAAFIRSTDDPMRLGSNYIDNEYVLGALNHLFQDGYGIISKSNDNIIFLIWSTRNHGRGIVYSIYGNTPTESDGLDFLIRIEPLSEEGWYFYVENFNVWRSRNR